MADGFNTKQDYLRKAHYNISVPADLDAQTSSNEDAEACFVYQRFSKRLQRFLIDYSIRVSSKHPIANDDND